ncbi:MAG: hypothetical protein H7X93_01705 [Sphingomonadaceae bacterium]|nr:hypothetical protein [Sphingomonadaceae bacterium]
MSLFGKLFGSGKPATAPPAAIAMPDFTVDRARMFDLVLTQRLQALVAMPVRDDAWYPAFFAALWNASIALPSQAPFVGPDGFPYLRLDIPAEGAFDSNSLANLARNCADSGWGAALFPSPDAHDPAYVLPMGALDSLLRFGDWRGDPIDLAEQQGPPLSGAVRLKAGAQVLTGAPSPDYLSRAAARALDAYLKCEWKLAAPRVMLMSNTSLRPSRSLVLNVRRADFGTEEAAADFCHRVIWFLPPSRVVTLLPDGWSEDQLFPLARIY